MREYGEFVLDGVSSKDFGIILTKPPEIKIAMRDVETFSVAGRSGDLTCDNGRYKNIAIPYSCAIIPEAGQSLRDISVSALSLISPSGGYKRLENSFHKGYFRLARISDEISAESIIEKAGTFAVIFDCKPQRFLVAGETPCEFLSPSVIVNPTGFNAQPLIVVYGTGPGTVTVGNRTVEIKELEDQITLDSELGDAYRQVGEGAPENKNLSVNAPEFPELLPGENPVTWDGGITSVTVTPRWWTL